MARSNWISVTALIVAVGAVLVDFAVYRDREEIEVALRRRIEATEQRLTTSEAALAAKSKLIAATQERAERLEASLAKVMTTLAALEAPPLPTEDKRPSWLVPPEDPANARIVVETDDNPWGTLVAADERTALRIVGEGLKRGETPMESLAAFDDGSHIHAFRQLDARFKTWEIEDTANCVVAYTAPFPEHVPFGADLNAAQALGTMLLDWRPDFLGAARFSWKRLIKSLIDSPERREWWRTKAPRPPKEILDAASGLGK